MRVLRYAALIPQELYEMDPQSQYVKNYLREWVKWKIGKNGDYIFQGKDKESPSNDWLVLELEAWKQREEHNLLSSKEGETLHWTIA